MPLFEFCWVAGVVVVGTAIVVYTAWFWSIPLAVMIKAARKSVGSAVSDLSGAFKTKKKKEK